jgi:hypothetical protein
MTSPAAARAAYYIVMVRMNQRTMRITLTNNLIQRLLTDEFMKKVTELEYMDWTDYDDFERKYGSDTSPDNYTMHKIVWGTYDSLGMMLMKGLADKEILYNSTLAFSGIGIWSKHREVLMEQEAL